MYKTTDGWVLVSVVGNPLFTRWVNLVGKPEWQRDPRFATDALRGEHAELISECMSDWTRNRATAEVLELLDQARIPCGEVLSPEEVLVNEQVMAMQYLVDMVFPGLDKPYPLPRTPIEFSARDMTRELQRPPLLGEHTDEILLELGFAAAEIELLHRDRVV